MNFFHAQDQARKRTTWLVVLFATAILALITVTCLLFNVTWFFMEGGQVTLTDPENRYNAIPNAILHGMNWQANAWIALGVLIAVGLASLSKWAILKAGGKAIADSLGARRITRDTRDPGERRLLNVVEEMAIASGTPVPPVYVMDDEPGINAFAAGYAPADAIVCVTRGSVVLLDRDRLQGVIAHEFSHILNGDMRLNIRLLAILAGILFIGETGRFILRSFSNRRSRNSRDGAGGIVFLGLGLLVVGYAGVFFGNLIKAAVSRQREFLADASAVQFTRNPEGIADALKLIGGHLLGAQVRAPNAGEISHFFFSDAVHDHFNSLFATHPRLEDRIRAIEPRWDGKFLQPPKEAIEAIASRLADDVRAHGVDALRQPSSPFPVPLATVAAAGAVAKPSLASAVDQAGAPEPAHVNLAQRLVASIPDTLRDAAYHAWSARAVIYGLLLDSRPAIREQQLRGLAAADPAMADLASKLADSLAGLETGARLPLIEMSMPALKEMSGAQFDIFRQQLVALAQADQRITPFEWALGRLLIHDLGPAFGRARPKTARYHSLANLGTQCQAVLSFLACRQHAANTPQAERAYAAGAQSLGVVLPFDPAAGDDLKALGAAIDTLALCYPLVKPGLLKAFATTLTDDGDYSAEEAEILRALSAILDCPLPPIDAPRTT